jgi:glutamyl-tRNA synthetase
MHKTVRVRFAPSPTGALHIGGVRTALYNYLFAKQHGGTIVLRIEDTDTVRFVPGAEEYINSALEWLGITLDEGVKEGGEYGPYRQSDRKEIYAKYATQLVEAGLAYYAFDTSDELDAARTAAEAAGNVFKYDAGTRLAFNNSLTQPNDVVQPYLERGEYVVRIKLNANEIVSFTDMIREEVSFNTNDMDDKVLFKGSTQMPTYHLANIVDDYLMKISHVIRGEEWLSSAPLHVLLYRYLGWEEARPTFAHLPLILRPTGGGKLSKRDGAKFNMPVFPMNFINPNNPEDIAQGFREWGFEPAAVLNFLALLGWNPGTDQEIFSLDEMVQLFSFDRVSKSGARFDFDKAKWFNQQYIMHSSNEMLAEAMQPYVEAAGYKVSNDYLQTVASMMKERVGFITEFTTNGYYLFTEPDYEAMQANEGKDLNKKVLKKWDAARKAQFESLLANISALPAFEAAPIKTCVEAFIAETGLGFGDVLPVLRLGLSGTMRGPDAFEMIALLGSDVLNKRMKQFFTFCDDAFIAN